MKKRILAVLLTLCMTLALLPGMAFAAGGTDRKLLRVAYEQDLTSRPDIIDREQIACVGAPTTPDTAVVNFHVEADRRFSSSDVINALRFSITLSGATAAEVVPVAVTFPVPTAIDLNDLVLLHYDTARDLWVDADPVVMNSADRLVSLTLEDAASFGDFVIAETAPTDFINILKSDNGEVIPSARHAAQGDRVSLYIHPDNGYELDTLTVTDSRGRSISCRSSSSDAYSFTMPSTFVTVEATFKAVKDSGTSGSSTDPADEEVFSGLGTPGISGIVLNPAAMPFTDVKGPDWFYNHVEYMWKHYLMSGVSDTQFAPDTTTSRGMIWTILARMNNVRTDINPGSTWYEKGMLWCMEQGVTDGSNPLAEITREQLATMLWRNAGKPGGNGDLSKFSDSASVSGYAVTAMRWAVGLGVLNGTNGQLNPQGTATRAQVAAMVARYGDKTVR